MIDKIICPVCSRRKNNKFWAMPGYSLARCSNCGLVWDYLPRENLISHYQKSYFNNNNPKGGYANYFEGMEINRKTFAARLKKIEKIRGKKGKFLDVGCALGDCLMEAKKLGWKKVEGLEVSDYAYRFAKKRKLKVKKGLLKANSFPSNSFDIVAYQDVLEHITDPVGELREVFKLLKPGGLIFLVTPDIEGWWAKLLGPLWYHYKPVEHVVYFSQHSMERALKKAGFVDIKTSKTYHILSVEYTLNRLRFYQPRLFAILLKVVQKTAIKDIAFRAYSGELEAWGTKPK